MAAIRDIRNPWRDALVPASFRGVVFHVETSGRSSGRRTVVHQYPKRNIPYSEDMGREAIKWSFNGYLIMGDRGIPGNIVTQMRDLIDALEADDAGTLIHPILGDMLVMCDRYSYSDARTKGGYVEFDMQFVEAGKPAMEGSSDAGSNLDGAAQDAEDKAVDTVKKDTAPPLPRPRPAGV